MGLYVVAKCPDCNYLQVVEIQTKDHLYRVRTKCRRCKRSFKLIYKNKPSWQSNLAILKIFTSSIEAREKLKEIKLSFYNGVEDYFGESFEGSRG